jgi:DNA-directed RNA polymerase specialized sigma24 family protein
MLAAYAAAVDRLPVVTRVIFLLHRVDDLSYAQIAQRLSISSQSVQACVAEALGMIAAILDGDMPTRWRAGEIAPVERELRQRYRSSCEARLQALGYTGSLPWDSGRDDRLIVTAALLQTLPAVVLETFLLDRVDGLTYRQIARRMRTFRCVVRRRMLHAIRHLDRQPITFEQWLCAGALA